MDRRDQDRDEVPNSKAFPTTSRSVSTSSRAPRRTSTRCIVDHLDEAAFLTAEELARSERLVVDGGALLPGPRLRGLPELQQAAIEEYSADRGECHPHGALFSFDHSELEESLSADYANLEETARELTSDQVNASVAALAEAQRIVIVGVDQMAFFASSCGTPSACWTSAPRSSPAPAAILQRLGRIDESTLVITPSRRRAHPLLLRAMKLALHRGARTLAISDATMSKVGARRDDALLLLQQTQLHAVPHGVDGPRTGFRPTVCWRGMKRPVDRIRAYKLK